MVMLEGEMINKLTSSYQEYQEMDEQENVHSYAGC